MQDRLDRAAASGSAGLYQVFFDADETSLKPGAVANLEIIADSLRGDPHAALINVVGHSDDSGKPEYSERVSEARARSVAAYLVARGLSQDQIVVKSFGSKRPIATNSTPAGRQLNRRVDIYISKER
jgi:outer membrane protein OmpA-like peptidoglycan-associated protein